MAETSSLICFHNLVGNCTYLDGCYKKHDISVEELTPNQAKAFKKFTERGGISISPSIAVAAVSKKPAAKLTPKPKVVPAAAKKANKPVIAKQEIEPVAAEETKVRPDAAQGAEVAEDDIASCYDYAFGLCTRGESCKWIHRKLIDFTDEELIFFQKKLRKVWPKACFDALQGRCEVNDCGRVHKSQESLTPYERSRYERFLKNSEDQK